MHTTLKELIGHYYRPAFRLVIFVAFSLVSLNISSSTVHGVEKIRYSNGNDVIINSSFATSTLDLYSTIPSANHLDKNVVDFITLGIDHDVLEVYDQQSYDLKVTLNIVARDVNNNSIQVNNGLPLELKLEVRPFTTKASYLDKFTYHFKDAYKYTITITSIEKNGVAINTLPRNIFINSEIQIERYLDFTPMVGATVGVNAIQSFDIDGDGTIDEYEISWNTVPSAEDYQVEWTFVNDYGATNLNYIDLSASTLLYDFKGNSTRVTLGAGEGNNFKITNIFEHGYLLYRIRAIGRDLNNTSISFYSDWSLPDNSAVNYLVNNGTCDLTKLIHITQGHQEDKNWQLSATYAEGGKKKEVISYFDGSFRNRQTVTKVNSDKNVIVDETIYDYQGRPAISILSTPVKSPSYTTSISVNEPSLTYYNRFNKNTTNESYSRIDFDQNYGGNNCQVSTPPMSTSNGAAHYYSDSNTELQDQQKFVPHAKGYPFSQVEYTPDNTGRMARQSGLGPDYQFNTGHETKYYYGSPFQPQLDRMFGSEVGYASHYKKNLVIDGNQQISIVYMDQEGRTIATSLAGNPPSNNDNTYPLAPLASEGVPAQNLHVDLFGKDANGHSITNAPNSTFDGIIFNQQILIDNDGTVNFDYNLNVNQFVDPCLNDNICINCIYNLEIRVTDECANNLVNPEISKQIGTFSQFFNTTTNREEIQFNCTNQTGTTTDAESFAIHLQVGSYTVSKILTLNQTALELYQQAYIDSTYNHCVRTKHDFISDALAHIDTSGCYVNCESCVNSLGDRDDFVAQGKGTAAQFDALVEQCLKPCKTVTTCEATYEALLSDVRPGGQYGEYSSTVSVYDPQNFPLSVYNLSNSLPENISLGNANWRHPVTLINGTSYNGYYDPDGTRSQVVVSYNAAYGWSPQINTGVNPVLDPTLNVYKVYPEELLNLSDFIANFQTNWAKGLVMYHPEYCYYKNCSSYSYRQNQDVLSSDEFDQKMRNQQTFYKTGNTPNDFIKSNYMTYSSNNRLVDFIKDISGSTPGIIDPFFTPTSYYQTQLNNAGSSLNLHAAIKQKLTEYVSYVSGGTTIYVSMAEMAASQERCATNITTSLPASCTNFGAPGNITIQNQEWRRFVTFYLGEKAKLQLQYESEIANLSCHVNNICIGDADFSPSNASMVSGGNSSSFWTSSFFDPLQPCSINYYQLYVNKVKRFVGQDDIAIQSQGDAEYEMYLQTGQCPVTYHFQNLLSALASGQKLVSVNEPLASHGEFTPTLYDQLNGGPNITGPVYTWNMTSSAVPILNIKIINTQNGNVAGTVQLDITGSPVTSWNDIVSIIQLSPTGTGVAATYGFSAKAGYMNNGSITYFPITGSTTINIEDCSFEETCSPNQFALDISTILNGIAASNNLTNSSGIQLAAITSSGSGGSGISNLNDLITNTINTTLGLPSGSQYNWVYDNVQTFYLKGPSLTSLELKITSADPSTFALNSANFSQIKGFSNINSKNYNLFEIDALNTNGIKIATLTGTAKKVLSQEAGVPIEMGSCGLPTPVTCKSPAHIALQDLQNLFHHITQNLPNSDLIANNIDIYNNSYLTPALVAYLPAGATSSQSHVFEHFVSLGVYTQDLFINVGTKESMCQIKWHLEEGKPRVSFSQFTGLTNDPLIATGTPDVDGNLYSFEFQAVFNLNGKNEIRTITGSSCIPLKNCDECPDNNDPSTGPLVNPPGPITDNPNEVVILKRLPYDSLSYVQYDSTLVAAGIMEVDTSLTAYGKYVAAIDSSNLSNGLTSGDSLYLVAESYVDYAVKGAYLNINTQLKSIVYYDPAIDNATKTSSIDQFALNYGSRVNAGKEYKRYESALTKYNERALTVQGATILSPISSDLFHQNQLDDIVREYIKYLKPLPTPGNYAVGVLEYFNRTDPGAFTTNCDSIYRAYVLAYNSFENAQANNNTCKNYQVVSPLLSFDEFMKNNLCCSQQGVTLITDYINLLLDPDPCPGPLPRLDNCNTGTGPGGTTDGECQNLFTLYKSAVQDYNASAYAAAHNYMLPLQYTSWKSFIAANLCGCVKDYISYLQQYIEAAANAALELPVGIDQFEGCSLPVGDGSDECKDKYNQYLVAVAQYQQYAKEHKLPQLSIVNYEQYVSSGYCNCIDKYIDLLTAIVNGNVPIDDNLFKNLTLDENCKSHSQPPCSPTQPPGPPYISPPYTDLSTNDCAQQAINNAILNGTHQYEHYIDSIADDFAIRYKMHCMGAVEDFFMDYANKEYHFTLYYYDQAGNLVKTVPPEGINLLSLTPALSSTISHDRLNNTQSVFTEHQLATTYEYNSLNQLVKQNMPDHEMMDVFDYTLPNGLDADLKITSIQYVSNSRGYLTGTISPGIAYGSNTIERGYLYETNDGGQNWTKVRDLVGANINKIQMIDLNRGFAVCDDGILLRTQDGGLNWDFIPMYLNNYFDASVSIKTAYANFNDLYFNGNNGVIVGDNGTILYTTNGGNTFLKSSGVPSTEDITAVSFDGTSWVITTNYSDNVGSVDYEMGSWYISTNLAAGFTKQKVTAGNLKSVNWVNANNAYAVGDNGTLLRYHDGTSSWYAVPTLQTSKIIDVYFKSILEGVAIFETGATANTGELFKTFDGGFTWEPLGLAGDYYASLNKYTNDKLLAVGMNGLVARVLLTYQPFGIIKLTPPSGSPLLTAGDAQLYSSGTQLQVMVASNSGVTYVCDDALQSTNTWTPIALPGVSAKKILIESPPSGNRFNGVVVSNTGFVTAFTRDGANLLIASSTLNNGSPNYTDVVFKAGDYFLLDNNNNKKLTRFNLTSNSNNGATLPPTVNIVSQKTSSPVFSATINSIDINASKQIAAVGATGAIYISANVTTGGPTLNWTDYSKTIVPGPLNDVASAAAGRNYLVGNFGAEYYADNTNTAVLALTSTTENLSAIKIDAATNTALVGGANGFAGLQFLNGAATSTTIIPLPITDSVTDIIYNSTSGVGRAYISFSSGNIVVIANAGTSVPVLSVVSGDYAFNGLTFNNSTSQVYAVGDHAQLFNYSGLGGLQMTGVNAPALSDANFLEANQGFIVGNYGFIRNTSDGTLTCNVVRPAFNKQGYTAKLNAVYTSHNNHAAIVGQDYNASGLTNKAYIASVLDDGINSTPAINGTSNPINDIEGNSHGVFAVGDKGKVYGLTVNSTSYIVATPVSIAPNSVNLNGIHVFREGSYITCGTGSSVYYVDGAGLGTPHAVNTNLPAGLTLNDVYFHDDRMGYVVGNAGAFYKISFTVNIQGIGNFSNNSWQPLLLNDDYGINSSNSSQVDVEAIAFCTRYNGILGGKQNMSTVGYARLIDDESQYYSTRFWYDRLGRMILSQNTKQKNKANPTTGVKGAFSYTLYDPLGRIKEVGEKFENTGAPLFKTIFGTIINNYLNPKAIDDTKFNLWIDNTANDTRYEVTSSYYDNAMPSINPTIHQHNLRNRAANITYEDKYDNNPTTYEHATHYTYDILGNVNSLWQENKALAGVNPMLAQQSLKRIDYDYDLISDKVNKIVYQKDMPDMYIHKYMYDADNRITDVYTSRDNINWDNDAHYLYYAHGPLARTEIGDLHIQGVDFAYTLQGWIKGTNSNLMKPDYDMGKDGLDPSDFTNPNGAFARDVFGYSLNYFQGDYEAIDPNWSDPSNKRFVADYEANADVLSQRFDLYNGNISSMVTTLSWPEVLTASTGSLSGSAQGNAYRYDQLNRLLASRSYTNLDEATNTWQASGIAYGNKYYNEFSYDANGNINTQKRHNEAGTIVEDLTYNYYDLAQGRQQNRLYSVNDATGVSALDLDDITDQGTFQNSDENDIKTNNNYSYTAIGELMKDASAEIQDIKWTVYGKIKSVIRTAGSSKKSITFDYDASGNRIAKHVYSDNSLSSGTLLNSTYYLRDDMGNTMAVYKMENDPLAQASSYSLKERHIYGSSRIGMDLREVKLLGTDTTAYVQEDTLTRRLGTKVFEFGNHLGNVLVTLTDKKIPRDENADGVIDYYLPDLQATTDYYGFGVSMKPRSWHLITNGAGAPDYVDGTYTGANFDQSNYRYGFNGKEKDNEIYGDGNIYDYGFRIYDPRLGKFLSIDPLTTTYPWYTPYQFAGNKPIISIDIDGLEENIIIKWTKNGQLLGIAAIKVPKEWYIKQKLIEFEVERKRIQTMMEENKMYMKGKKLKEEQKRAEAGLASLEKAQTDAITKIYADYSKVLEVNKDGTTYVAFDSQDAEQKKIQDNPEKYVKQNGDLKDVMDPKDQLILGKGETDIYPFVSKAEQKMVDNYRAGKGNILINVPQALTFEFENNSASLSETAKKELDNLFLTMKLIPYMKINLVGYTDDVGSPGANASLSLGRANASKEYLVKKGIEPDRISAEGKGAAKPIGDNKTEAGRAKNRRIEIIQQ